LKASSKAEEEAGKSEIVLNQVLISIFAVNLQINPSTLE
jgi:hypothetical protein